MSVLKQPKQIYLLSFVEMWNRFSQFGMRTLLVLFMIKGLKLPDSTAFGTFAVFASLDKLSGLLGAYVASHFLGLKKTIFLGGWIIALGHLALAASLFYSGLALLVVGSGLFTTNILALMGQYNAKDPEIGTSGYTLFYMGINIGALIATILCSFVATKFGFEYGFGLAAIGMLIGNFALLKGRNLLTKEPPVKKPKVGRSSFFLPSMLGTMALAVVGALYFEATLLYILPVIAVGASLFVLRHLKKDNLVLRPMILPLIGYFLFLVAESQVPSSLIVFADRMSAHTFFGFSLSPTSILTLNPVVIISMGALSAYLYKKMALPSMRIVFPFLITAVAFALPLLFKGMSFGGLMGVVALISFAELFVIPPLYQNLSSVAAANNKPIVTALIPLGFAVAFLTGGGVSKLVAHQGFETGYGLLIGVLLIGGVVLSLMPQGKKQMQAVTE